MPNSNSADTISTQSVQIIVESNRSRTESNVASNDASATSQQSIGSELLTSLLNQFKILNAKETVLFLSRRAEYYKHFISRQFTDNSEWSENSRRTADNIQTILGGLQNPDTEQTESRILQEETYRDAIFRTVLERFNYTKEEYDYSPKQLLVDLLTTGLTVATTQLPIPCPFNLAGETPKALRKFNRWRTTEGRAYSRFNLSKIDVFKKQGLLLQDKFQLLRAKKLTRVLFDLEALSAEEENASIDNLKEKAERVFADTMKMLIKDKTIEEELGRLAKIKTWSEKSLLNLKTSLIDEPCAKIITHYHWEKNFEKYLIEELKSIFSIQQDNDRTITLNDSDLLNTREVAQNIISRIRSDIIQHHYYYKTPQQKEEMKSSMPQEISEGMIAFMEKKIEALCNDKRKHPELPVLKFSSRSKLSKKDEIALIKENICGTIIEDSERSLDDGFAISDDSFLDKMKMKGLWFEKTLEIKREVHDMTDVEEKFQHVGERLRKLEVGQNTTNQRLENVEERLEGLEKGQKATNKRLDTLEEGQRVTNTTLAQILQMLERQNHVNTLEEERGSGHEISNSK